METAPLLDLRLLWAEVEKHWPGWGALGVDGWGPGGEAGCLNSAEVTC